MSTSKRLIDRVTDNKDKQHTYQVQLGRYKKAVANEFYFEAMMIVYGMLEDRMRSFLYYIGAFKDVNELKLCKTKAKSNDTLKRMYCSYLGIPVNSRMNFNNISTKMNMVKATLQWVVDCDCTPTDEYLKVLKREYEGCVDMDGLLTTIGEIEAWCKYRNEVVHGLLNKNTVSLEENLGEMVEKGMHYARFVDSQVKCLKRKNAIRKSLHL